MLEKNSVNYDTVTDFMLPLFKDHIRVVPENDEEALIKMYLSASISSIETFSGMAIHSSEWLFTEDDYTVLEYSKTGLIYADTVEVYDADGILQTGFTVVGHSGIITPKIPTDGRAILKGGYPSIGVMPPNLISIIFRYGAYLYEMRESVQTGMPKLMPDWVNYAIASIHIPRV